jgi:hypothetical protein
MKDPIVQEIRMYRNQHSKEFNYDLDAICNDYKSKHGVYLKRLEQLKSQKNNQDRVKQIS